jgi:hypothetical protein
MLNVFKNALQIISQLFRSKPTEFISNSGKGDKEVSGRFVRLEKTARGLTVVVNDGTGEKRVSWRMNGYLADRVLSLSAGATFRIPSANLRELSDDGETTLGEFLGWCSLVNLIVWNRSDNTVRIADDVLSNA